MPSPGLGAIVGTLSAITFSCMQGQEQIVSKQDVTVREITKGLQ
jgi:hypothetical protein